MPIKLKSDLKEQHLENVNMIYQQLGLILILNQLLEQNLKLTIESFKLKKSTPMKNLDEYTLGQLIKELEENLPKTDLNTKKIKLLRQINIQRIKFTHHLLNTYKKNHRTYADFVFRLFNSNKFNKLIQDYRKNIKKFIYDSISSKK